MSITNFDVQANICPTSGLSRRITVDIYGEQLFNKYTYTGAGVNRRRRPDTPAKSIIVSRLSVMLFDDLPINFSVASNQSYKLNLCDERRGDEDMHDAL